MFGREEEVKPSVDGLERAQAARFHDADGGARLRVVEIHKRFKEGDVVGLGRGGHAVELVQRDCQGLFAQDVLARLRGGDGPFTVQRVGQGDVDGVDLRVGEHVFIGAVGRGDPLCGGIGLGLGQIAAGDAVKFAA